MPQSSFLHLVCGDRWVEAKPGHRLYPAGTRFLVVETLHDKWLVCWRDGVPPDAPFRGTVLDPGEVVELEETNATE